MTINTNITGIKVDSSADNGKVPVFNSSTKDFDMTTGGATTALDNLASVAINTSLISDTDNTDNLGSSLIRWATGFFTNLGATGTRIVQGWFTDLTVTNAIVGSITGNAATATTATGTNALYSATTTVNVSSATAPTSGQVLTATSSTAATWQTPGGGGAWSLRSYSTATATSITVSSLNLTTDNNHYRVIVDMAYSTVSERDLLQCQINGITTSDTYGTVGHGRSMDFSAGTGTARTINYLGAQWRFNAVGGNNGHMVMDFYATKTDSGTARITGTYNMTSNYEDVGAEDFSNYEGAVFQNSQTNITSLRFFHNGSENKVWRVWVLYPAIS